MGGRLEGRVAIVTGGARGMGREHSLALARAGASVIVNDVGGSVDGHGDDRSPAEAVVSEIEALGGTARADGNDVSSWDGARALVDGAVSDLGRLDIVVNNAGIVRDRVLVNLDEDDWDAVVRVHLKGTFAVTRWAASHWRAMSKSGDQPLASVVNTTSPAGMHGNVGQSNYAAAKSAIATFTVTAASELDRYGVRVNAISPAARTRITETVPSMVDLFAPPDDPAEFDKWAPANISPLVVYLALPDCPLTGHVLAIQGSEVAQYQGWTVGRRFETDGRWTVEALEASLTDLTPCAAGVGL
jgi:NAD(P)-dependent dehydrogenase (short-subunit alcohol dehydrogenase family)